MQTASQTGTISKGAIWTGRVLSGLVVLFLTFDGVMKLSVAATGSVGG